MTWRRSELTREEFDRQIETTRKAIADDLAKLNAASVWIALALCRNKSTSSGKHTCCASTVCSGKHFRRVQKDIGLDEAKLFYIAKRPKGLRDVLFDEHPVVSSMRSHMRLLKIRNTSEPLLTPRYRKQIRGYLAARLRFLFDASLPNHQQRKFVQGDVVAETCRHVLGWTFDDVVELFEWAWDNKKSGGAGRGSFARLWARDLKGFLALYPWGNATSGWSAEQDGSRLMSRVKPTCDTVIPVLEAVIGDLFELERVVDCLKQLKDLRAERMRMTSLQKIVGGGLISPLQIFIARDKPNLLKPKNHIQHAYVAGHVATRHHPKSRHLSSYKDDTEAFFVGWDDLDYSLHAIIEINRRRKETFKTYKTDQETSLLNSRTFQLALNLVAVFDPERAKQYLYKRLSEEQRPHVAATVLATEPNELSLFEINLEYSQGACFDENRPAAEREVEITNCLELERPGASYVNEFKTKMSSLRRRGLTTSATCPNRRAFYFREGWTASAAGAALSQARKENEHELVRLNKGFTSEPDESRSMETSKLITEHLIECVLPPLTDRSFAVSLSEQATGKNSKKNIAKNPHNQRKPPSGTKSIRKRY